MTHWYISFVDEDGFLGATVVEATSARRALKEATRHGVNPGGEAAILPAPLGKMNDAEKREMLSYLNRLVTEDELKRNGARRAGDCSEEIQDVFDIEATKVCQDCNDV